MQHDVAEGLRNWYDVNGHLTLKQTKFISNSYKGGIEAFMKTVKPRTNPFEEEQTDEGVNNMSDLNLLLAEQNENFKIVKVTFPNTSKAYTYKTVLDIEKGNLVIVDTPSSGFTIVEVQEVLPAIETNLDFGFNVKWIVSKVDTEQYDACLTMERAVTKSLNKLKYSRRRHELIHDLECVIGLDGLEHVKQLIKL